MIQTEILENNKVVSAEPTIGKRGVTVWTDMVHPTEEEWEQVASHLDVSVRELTSLLELKQRPIVQDIGRFTVIVFHSVSVVDDAINAKPHLFLVSKEQKDFVSIHQEQSKAVEKVRKYPQERKQRIFKKGSTALLIAVLDEMLAAGYEAVDFINEEIEKVEDELFAPDSSEHVLRGILSIKKKLIYFQRLLSADREVLSGMEKSYGKFLDDKQAADFRYLYSDMTQIIEMVTTYREVVISTLEVHLSAVSNNLNVVMKRLTAWASIILVPSLIAGIYGMNFAFLPFARKTEGFFYVLAIMLVSVGLLYAYFKRKDWI